MGYGVLDTQKGFDFIETVPRYLDSIAESLKMLAEAQSLQADAIKELSRKVEIQNEVLGSLRKELRNGGLQ